LEALAIFGLFGWGAGAFGFFAGEREAERQQRNIERAKYLEQGHPSRDATESPPSPQSGRRDAQQKSPGGAKE
jgi:hypothetical protein